MNISAINAVNTTTNSNKPKPVTTPVNFEGVNNMARKGNLMKGMALAGMLAAATAFIGCAQPTGGNIPEETPIENPTQPTEPTTPVTPTEPTTPSTEIKDSAIYKFLESFGCVNLSTEKVTAPEGHYQPKKGDITTIEFDVVPLALDFRLKLALDTKNSTEGDLKYNLCYYDIWEPWAPNELTEENAKNTVVIDKDEKSFLLDTDSTSYKFKFNDDGTVTSTETYHEDSYRDDFTSNHVLTVGENGNLYESGNELYANLKVKFAE